MVCYGFLCTFTNPTLLTRKNRVFPSRIPRCDCRSTEPRVSVCTNGQDIMRHVWFMKFGKTSSYLECLRRFSSNSQLISKIKSNLYKCKKPIKNINHFQCHFPTSLEDRTQRHLTANLPTPKTSPWDQWRSGSTTVSFPVSMPRVFVETNDKSHREINGQRDLPGSGCKSPP